MERITEVLTCFLDKWSCSHSLEAISALTKCKNSLKKEKHVSSLSRALLSCVHDDSTAYTPNPELFQTSDAYPQLSGGHLPLNVQCSSHIAPKILLPSLVHTQLSLFQLMATPFFQPPRLKTWSRPRSHFLFSISHIQLAHPYPPPDVYRIW